ncbi:MAG: hypothetical protein M0R06_25830 [Sphaerochaeta sp.]|jgi:CMP-N-acetylneuraminic acid synthetase|nr:hypothetical protein [Sphaerochaeta sp.]
MTSFLGIILARAGSKRLPNKNIMPFHYGADIVELAVDRCVVYGISTILSTDIPEYLQAFKSRTTVKVMERPEHLRGDEVDPVDVVLDLLNSIEEVPDYIILMQPTSRTWSFGNMLWAMDWVDEKAASGMFSVNPAYKPNGCFYIVRTADFLQQRTFFVENTFVYVMSWEESVDIDNLWDFRIAQAILNGQVTGR